MAKAKKEEKNWPEIMGQGKYALFDDERSCLFCQKGDHDSCELVELTFCLCYEEDHETLA